MRVLREDDDITFGRDEIRRVLILNDDDLSVFVQTQQIAIEHLLEVRPTQVIVIALRLPICEQRGVKHDKTGVRQTAFTTKFHQANFHSGMSNRPKTFTRTASVLAGNLESRLHLQALVDA